MSYQPITPSFYKVFAPGSRWHAGAPGWSVAPVPGWGDNPNLVGPARLAVEGLGAYYQNRLNQPIAGLGAYYQNALTRPIAGLGCGCRSKPAVGDDLAQHPGIGLWALAGAALGAAAGYAMSKEGYGRSLKEDRVLNTGLGLVGGAGAAMMAKVFKDKL